MTSRKYGKTYAASFLGMVNHAVIVNLTAVLFVPFMQLYGFKFWQLGVLAAINFVTQIVADIIMTAIINKTPFRPLIIFATSLALVGLVFYGLTPMLFPVRSMYAGIVTATVVFAFAGGIFEVALSPVIDNIPTSKNKNGIMALFHSFYAWGQVLCILITAVYLLVFKAENWNYILFFWAIVPAAALLFALTAPFDKKPSEKNFGEVKKTLFNPFFIIALLAILFGAGSEVFANQWTSTFIVDIGLDKATADLLGMGMFTVFLGLGRLLYSFMGDKVNVNAALVIGSAFTMVFFILAGTIKSPAANLVFCMLCGLTTSLLWPGTLVVVSKKLPSAGVWIFAALAIAGDAGAAIAPAAAGFIADASNLRVAFLIVSVFPLAATLCHLYLAKHSKQQDKQGEIDCINKEKLI